MISSRVIKRKVRSGKRDIFLNSITPVAVEMVYAIAEAIAAPFIPITGIRTKSKMIVVTAEKIAVYVPYSGLPVPEKPAQSTLLMLKIAVPIIKMRKGMRDVVKSGPNMILINVPPTKNKITLKIKITKSALRQIKEVKLCASSFFMPETSGKSTVAMALEICHGNSATATAIA